MTKRIISLRNVTIIAYLAVITLFSGCEKDPDPIDPGTEQETNIVSFTFVGIDGTATIDKNARTVTAKAKETTDLTTIKAEFTLSVNAIATVNGVTQVSKNTANDFTNPVIYKVTSADGKTTNNWTVTITKEGEEIEETNITITTESGISGECTWILDEYHNISEDSYWRILTISGNGAMEDYQMNHWWDASNPWRQMDVDTIIVNNGVTSIGDYAFTGQIFLKYITIPNSVIRIGSGALGSCWALTDVTIPESVTHIGSEAFAGCDHLTSVTIPKNLKEIGAGVFRSCSELFSEHSSGIESFLPNDSFWKEGKNPFTLDGWYYETYEVSLNGEFTSLSFTFRDKYDELGIEDCVYIETDSKRVYPIQQTGDNYVLDLKDVDILFIKSIRPGKSWTPYSQEITLNDILFHR